MDIRQFIEALERYHKHYNNTSYQAITAGLTTAHAIQLGCACADVALALCGYAQPDLAHSIKRIRRDSRKRRRLAADFLRLFKGVW